MTGTAAGAASVIGFTPGHLDPMVEWGTFWTVTRDHAGLPPRMIVRHPRTLSVSARIVRHRTLGDVPQGQKKPSEDRHSENTDLSGVDPAR